MLLAGGLLGSLASAAAPVNVFVGADGGSWLEPAAWSLSRLPQYPDTVQLDKDAVLTGVDRSNGLVVLDGVLTVQNEGVHGIAPLLVLGPKECWATQTQVVAPTATANTVCQDNVVCTAAEWETRPHTATLVRACQPLTQCKEDEYETTAPTATSDRACATHTTCTAGMREQTAPTSYADRVCTACTTGTFKAVASNAASCTPWRTCAVGAGLRVEGSATVDRQCTPCALGATFSASAGGTACEAVRGMCPAGEHVFAAATASSDLECAHCAPGHYTPAAGHGECIRCDGFTEWQPASRSVSCRAVTTCLATEYEVSPPTHLVDRVCAVITLCAPGTFETTPPALDHDRVCTSCAPGRAQNLPEAKWCPQCDRGRYQGQAGATDCVDCAAGTAGGATGLSACPQCEAGRYSEAPRQAACKGCAMNTFAESAGASSCATCEYHCASGLVKHSCGAADAGTCVPCLSHEFKAEPGTHGCRAHVNPDCLAGHRESTAPSTTADRVCTKCGEFEHKPLAGNDATCAACPAGYKAHADRLSCFAFKCSHIRCKYEEHTCRWGRPDKDLRAWVGLTFHAQPGHTCENGARYTSVRVDHGANKHCAASTPT